MLRPVGPTTLIYNKDNLIYHTNVPDCVKDYISKNPDHEIRVTVPEAPELESQLRAWHMADDCGHCNCPDFPLNKRPDESGNP